MDEPLDPQDERSAIAAELALGLLEGADRATALRLRLSDPDFARLVEEWEARLAPLHGQWAHVRPRDAVWDAVAARIGAPTGNQRALVRWRAGALLGGALAAGLAAGLAIVLVVRAPMTAAPIARSTAPPVARPVVIAQMVGSAQGPIVLARYDPGSGQLKLRLAGVAADRLAPELWVIPAGGAPISLGLIPSADTAIIAPSDDHRALLVEGATLAVTMEPADGAPHAAPSAAPIAAGEISII